MYNYLGVIRKSTAINHCVSCYFLDSKTPNLILSKNNKIEFYHLTPEGISQDRYIDIYGKIKILLSVPQGNIKYKDNLFVLSSDLDYCLFSYNLSNHNIDSQIKGTIREDLGKIEDNIVYSLDSKKNYLLICAYKNIFKIICVNNNMRLNDQYRNYTIRFNYENIIFLAPLLYDKTDNKNENNQSNENDNNILTFIAIKSDYIESKNNSIDNSNIELKQGIFLESFDIDMDPSSFDPPKLLYKKPKVESNNKTQNINLNFKIKKQLNNSSNDNNINSNKDNNIKNSKNRQLISNSKNNNEINKTIKYNHQKLFDSKVFLRILNIEENGSINLMITHPDGLVIIFFSKIVFYYKYNPNNSIISTSKSMAYDERKFVDYVTVDEKKYKYYVIDENGTLFLLGFLSNKKNRANMEFGIISLQILGKVNNCSCMAYLTNNILFIGSTKCNSQLIRINENKDNDTTPQIEVIEEYESLSPIRNIALINNTKEENGVEILTVSGTDSNCSIKDIKKGKNVLFSGEIEIKDIINVFKIIINKVGNKEELKKNNMFNYCSFIITTMMKSFIFNYDYKNKIISLNNSFSFNRNELVKYAKNIQNLILIITNLNIYFYKNNSELTLLSNYPINKLANNSLPLIIKYNKNQCGLFIYYNSNNLIKYKIDNDNGKIINNEIIIKNVSISAFDICSYFMIYSFWDSNQIGIYSFNSNKINYISEFGEYLNFAYISSIQIIKINDEYFIFISLSIGKMIYLKLRDKINKSYVNYEFKSEDFILKNSYNLNLENFKIKKLKKKNQKFLFLDNTFPCFIFFNHNNLIISNFNANHCKDILVLDNEDNYYMFIFNDKISFGSLSNNQNQNIYLLKSGKVINSIKLVDFGKNDDISGINNKRINKYKQMKYILTIEEEEIDNMNVKSIISSLILNDLNMKEISRYIFEYENEINMTLAEINLPNNEENNKYFILGTGITDIKRSEPVIGHLYLIEININNNFSIKKLQELEIKEGVYKIDVYQNIIYVGIKGTLKIYSINKKNAQNFYEFKLLRQCNDFMLINNIYVLKDKSIQEEEEKDTKKEENKDTDKEINKIFICDLYKSIMLYNYDIANDKLTEESRDYNLTWIYNILQCFPNLIYITDIDDNITTLEKIYHSKNEKEKLKLEKKSYFNYGERINIIKSTEIINKELASLAMNTSNEDEIELYKDKAIKNDTSNDSIKITFFGTMEGSIGYIVPLNKETYEFLYILQEVLIKKLNNNGGFNYKKWRSFKDGYISNEPKGYIEGEIISKFLNYDDNNKKIIVKEMNYPWKKSINEIVNIIETLNKFC